MTDHHAHAMSLINAALAKPKTHVAVIAYSDGSEHRLECSSKKAADNHLEVYRNQVGRDLISRKTGNTIRLVSREVKEL